MNNLDIFAMGLKNLWRRKVRSLLTVLGVIIGTAAIVVMISLSVGIEDAMVKQFESMGDLSMIEVWPGYDGRSQTTIDEEMMDEIAAIEGVQVATPIVDSYARIMADRYELTTSIIGIRPEALPYLGINLADGRLLTEEDDMVALFGGQVPQNFAKPRSNSKGGMYYGDMYNNDQEAKVDVMTASLRLTYDMGYDDGSGKKKETYRLETAGLLTSEGYNRYGYSVIMPLETVLRLEQENNNNNSRSGRYEPEYRQVMVKAKTIEDVDFITESIQAMGLQCHSLSQMLEEAKKSTELIRLILGGIGAISMLVAALGITNTMIMSIYERTREIGIMKVLGAKLGDIGKLFLIESAMIGLLGGLLGLGISYGLSYILNNVIMLGGAVGIPMGAKMSIIPPWLSILALVFTSSIGLISGLYPAIRAMRLSALEAIRTE
jgi:ABC-type antimicrobial peptide transport system permease subunit